MNTQTPIAYTVIGLFDDSAVADEWLAWLVNGHLAEVCDGGASAAEAVRLDREPGQPLRIEARYHFPSREVFDAYLRDHAPRLREDGLQRFPTSRGIAYERTVGEVLAVVAGEAP